jgi:uncharacterized protein (DUF433 family)
MSLLDSGIYTVPEAARLLGLPNQRARGWIAGYPRTRGAPIIKNQIEKIDDQVAMSFVNLMEARFLEVFSSHGIHLNSLRLMAQEAKEILDDPHPFAKHLVFKTDGRKVFAEVAEKTDDKRLYDLKTKNWAYYDILVEGLIKGANYDPSGIAKYWKPRPSVAPNVIVHPKIAFGQPVLKDSHIPTIALFDAFNAEGETYESVARWYEIKENKVKEAVRFEVELSRAA